jgi:hypothetical protein
VLDAAAVTNTITRLGDGPAQMDEVEQFRRFLDTASPEDFEPE